MKSFLKFNSLNIIINNLSPPKRHLCLIHNRQIPSDTSSITLIPQDDVDLSEIPLCYNYDN